MSSSNTIWTTGNGIVNQGFTTTPSPTSSGANTSTTTITKKELALTLQQLQLQHSNFNNNLNELCKSTNQSQQNHHQRPPSPHFNFQTNSPSNRKVSFFLCSFGVVSSQIVFIYIFGFFLNYRNSVVLK